uniref:Reverse transcriptase domain-containing protein n=1 Tax=Tanacetum cinerariifolium TaxID=118510 RepID=A0A6L2JBC1_TANCI|nr:hypothetical protein [Tanacetum cinerariifolium]
MILKLGDPDRKVPIVETFHEQTDDELIEKEEIWLRVQQLMKGFDIGIQDKKAKNKHFPKKIASNLKFLNNLQPEWRRHVTIVHQTKDLHEVDYTQLYDFLKYNQAEINEQRAKRLARAHDPLALMANSNNRYNYPVFLQDQPSSVTYMKQPQPNNNFNLQPSFNTNYMQQPMLNPKDIIDPITAMNMALVLMAKAFKLNYSTPTNNNQRISSNPHKVLQLQRQGHLARNCTVRPRKRDVAFLKSQLLIAQKEEARIQLQAEEFNFMVVAGYLEEIEEVNANCILMANLQQASTLGTQTNKALIYDSDGSAENDSNVISVVSNMEQSGGTVEQHPATAEETCALYDSLYNNLATKVKTNNSEAAKFVRDFKSLAKEADDSLAKHKALEFEIERLMRAVVSQDIMSIVQRLQAQLGDLKHQSKDTPCESDTLDSLSQKLENENVELDFSHGYGIDDIPSSPPRRTPLRARMGSSPNCTLKPLNSSCGVKLSLRWLPVWEFSTRRPQTLCGKAFDETRAEYFSEDYDEEREMEPRPERTREVTPPLRTRSPRVHIQCKRAVVGFEEALNRKGGRTRRNTEVHSIKQKEGKSVRAFATRYTDDTLQILGLHEDQRIFGFVHGLSTRNLVEHLSTDLPSTYKGLMEKTYTWIEIEEAVKSGQLSHLVKGIKKERAKTSDSQRGEKNEKSTTLAEYAVRRDSNLENKDGSLHDPQGCQIPYHLRNWNCVLNIRIKQNRRRCKENQRDLPVNTKGILSYIDAEEKIVINDKYPEQTVTIEKQLPEHFKERTIMIDGKPFNTEHKLNEYSHIKPIKKRRSLGLDHSTTTCKKVEELTRARILREAAHKTWVANPVMVESLSGLRLKYFMDAYKGYHSIQMAEEDEDKTSFFTGKKLKDALRFKKRRSNVSNTSRQGEHDIVFRARGDNNKEMPKKLIEAPLEDNRKEVRRKIDMKLEETKPSCEWKLYTDEASISDGSGAGLMLIDPKGNPKGVQDLTIEHIRRNQNKKVDGLNKLALMTFKHLTKEVLVEVLGKRSIKEKEVLQVETIDEESWMTPIYEYLLSGLLLEDSKESKKIRIKAPHYKLIRGSLYKKSFYTSWLRCIAPPKTDDPSMHRDVARIIQDCEKCKEQFAMRKRIEIRAIEAGNACMGKGLFGPNGERGRKVEVGLDNFGGEEIGNCGVNNGRGSSIFGRCGGSLAICLMKSKDGLGGGGLVVVGGRSSSEEYLDGWVGAGGGEIKGGDIDFGVTKSLLGEILGESGSEGFRVDEKAV